MLDLASAEVEHNCASGRRYTPDVVVVLQFAQPMYVIETGRVFSYEVLMLYTTKLLSRNGGRLIHRHTMCKCA